MARDGHRVIDAHHHVGTAPSVMVGGAAAVDAEAELAERLAVMDANGVDGALRAGR